MELHKRNIGIDIIKVLASFSVVAIHSFYNAGYYTIPLLGSKLFFLSQFRSVLNTCVPLFFLVTGYLSINSSISWKYYKKIGKLLVEFSIITILTYAVYYIAYGESFNIYPIFKNLFRLNEFLINYLLLFVFSPFLNVLYENLKNKREKQILILFIITFSSLPSLLNINFLAPVFSVKWLVSFPLIYYFIGRYIKEYQPVVKKYLLLLIILGASFIQTTILFYRAPIHGGTFRYFTGSYESIFIVIAATSIFLLLYKTSLSNSSLSAFLRIAANSAFTVYMFSVLVDNVLGYALNVKKNFIQDAPKMLIIVPISYFVSLLLSIILKKILFYISKFVEYIKDSIFKQTV
ncbi:acyltransferase [Carnobacterium maltaromaticum]|uniref:acyltransferase n=1 Tax=Carnobacterium maltaromaticum TaxID=2751 RepID=UPI0039BE35C3